MHAGDHDIEPCEQIIALIQRPILKDVHLDAGENTERRQLGIQLPDQLQLGFEPFRRQAVGNRQPRRVIGQRDPLMAQIARCLCHLQRRAAAVGPVAVHMTVAMKGCAHGRRRRLVRLVQQPPEVGRLLSRRGLDDDLGSRRADAWEFLQARVPEPPLKLWSRKFLHHPGGPAEGAHPVGRGTREFQLEGDVAEGLGRIHAV